MNTPAILTTSAGAIVFVFGTLHLVYTYWGRKLLPRDPALIESMKAVPIHITNETTVWKAWIGFNVSHSIALMLFGLVFGYLAVAHPEVLYGSVYLQVIGGLVLSGFLILARAYWFRVPLAGVAVALACYIAGSIVSLMGG